MISPVGHSSHADQAEQTPSTPHVQKTNDNNRTANAQDTVTVKKNTSDVDHDGDTK